MKIVSIWSSILQVVIQMVNEAMVVPGPYAASAITGSLVSYALYISGEWSTFGLVICIGIAYSLASFEVGAVRTVLKMIRSNRSYKSAVVLAAFALLVEIVIVISAHGKLPWIVIVVSLAFCFLPAIMYALRYMDEYSDEVLDSTRQKEALDVQLELERKRKEQEVELQRLAEQAKWEIEQERIKLENAQQKALAKINSTNYVVATSKPTNDTPKKMYLCPYCGVDQGVANRYSVHMRYCKSKPQEQK